MAARWELRKYLNAAELASQTIEIAYFFIKTSRKMMGFGRNGMIFAGFGEFLKNRCSSRTLQ
jgi:hypothetical protein